MSESYKWTFDFKLFYKQVNGNANYRLVKHTQEDNWFKLQEYKRIKSIRDRFKNSNPTYKWIDVSHPMSNDEIDNFLKMYFEKIVPVKWKQFKP